MMNYIEIIHWESDQLWDYSGRTKELPIMGYFKEVSMVKVIFKNLKKSEFVLDSVKEKIGRVLEKFPEMENASATISIEMENSPQHAGKDDFRVKLIMLSRGHKPIVIQKDSANVYQAASLLADRLFDLLHRSVEKKRDLRRAAGRTRRYQDVAADDLDLISTQAV